MIYLDNAATSIDKDPSTARAMYKALMDKNLANPSRGAHKLSINSLRELILVRQTIGDFFDLDDPTRVILTPNITYGLNIIIRSLFKKGDHLITSISEHNSVLRPLYDFRRQGGDFSFIGLDDDFNLRLDQIPRLVRKNTKALILTGASNISGKVTDLKKAHALARSFGLDLIIDGAQIAGCIDFSMRDFDQTIFAFTGHKGLHGPQGTGGFLVKGDFSFNQVFSGGSGFDSFLKNQPTNLPDLFEVGTINLPSFIGLKKAIEKISIDKPYQKLDILTRYLYKGLKDIGGLDFYTKLAKINAPIVSFNIKGINAKDLALILDQDYDICLRAGAHCAPLFHKRYKTVDSSILRASLAYTTRKEDLDTFINAIREIKNKNL
ncbi:MAG: aminotransferase class V-fold PLP-dependent enzyme [Anaerococcus sp.]|nr:aminotransferase class V-fold PLP-dependent enzyme [Anaerococcus sp.]